MPLTPTLALIAPLASFTSADWFQLAYPWVFFVLGLVASGLAQRPRDPPPGGSRRSTLSANEAHNTLTVNAPVNGPIHLTSVVIDSNPTAPASTQRPRRPTRGGSSSDADGEIALYAAGGVVAILVMALAYIWLGGVVLAVTVVTAMFCAGALFSRIVLGIRSRTLAGDWTAWAVLELVLAAATVAVGQLVDNPLVSPPGYEAIASAYRQESWRALSVWDPTTGLLAFQGVGTFLLALAAYLLLSLTASLVLKADAIRSTVDPVGWRRRVVTRSTSKRWIAATLTLTLGCLALSAAFGSGYLHRWWQAAGISELAAAKVLTPSIERRLSRVDARFVCTRRASVRITMTARNGGRLLTRSTRTCLPGANVRRVPMTDTVRSLRVTFTPLRAGAPGERRIVFAG